MLTKNDISKFYEYVDALGLKFPVAEIATRTGYSKGNISEVLSKSKEPSENFIKKFYEKFPKGAKDISQESIYSLVESNRSLVESNKILAKNTEELILLLKFTANDPGQIPINVEAKFSLLLELLAEVGSGKNYKSKQEAAAAFRKRIYGEQEEVAIGGTHKHLDR